MHSEQPGAALLEVAALEAGYRPVQVLWGVDLAVYPGQSVVLLGPNGAGKTTLLKTVLGLIPAWRGEVRFGGENLGRLRTDLRVRRGIAYMSETACFPGLSVEENIRIGAQALGRSQIRRRARELYALFPALGERSRMHASSLSGGERKMLGIAKALAGNPRLVVMDEPSAGLSPLYVKEVVRTLAGLRGHGLSFLIAEQNVKFLELADRVFTLDGGRIAYSGTVAGLRENDALRRAYFGLG